jgi:hypothetical protein
MVVEPTALGAIAGSVLISVFGLARRGRRASTQGPGFVSLAEACLKGYVEVVHERERRLTILAIVTALPPGASVKHRQADGTELSIQRPHSPIRRRRHASQ